MNLNTYKGSRNLLFLVSTLAGRCYSSPVKKSTLPSDQRLKSLQHVRERLDELEEIVTYYQYDLMNQQQEEETTVYEETPIPPDDVKHLKSLMSQQNQQRVTNEHTPQQLDQLSNELAAKRL